MKNFAVIVGFITIVAVILGALIPGMNCHVFIGSDEGALKWHQSQVEALKYKLQITDK
jgi:hypothetical protein